MVHHWVIFLLFFMFSGLGFAQDERYYRQIFTGELPKTSESLMETMEAQFNVRGPSYRIDLDGDKIEEIIEPQKRDGVDWIVIRNSSRSKIFESQILAMGTESVLYKIKLVDISPKARSLILYLDEGTTQGKRFESTARIFVITFENKDLSRVWIEQGPHFFHEKESQREQYWRRNYTVNVYDIDGDGTREIAVQYNHIQRIMRYKGFGEWKRF